MKMKSNFSTDLDFGPLLKWPSAVPAVALGKQLLCGFHLPDEHPVYAHGSDSEIAPLLKELYAQLTLPEIARLAKFLPSESILKVFGYSSSPETLEVLEMLPSLPLQFQNFLSAKKTAPQELLPLLNLNSDQQAWVANEILKADESRQESSQRLELLSDLLLMNFSKEELQGLSKKELSQKRYPVTTERDSTLTGQNFSWSTQIKSKFNRRGDKAGFEVQFFAGTPAELDKLAQNLSKVASEWNQTR